MIYIASPYSGDVVQNIGFAKQACQYCIEQGHTPLAPHLLYTQMLDDSNPAERETGLELGRHILERCDEMWVCGDRISLGMRAEIAEASRLGIPIRQITAELISGELKPAFVIWAKARLDSPLAGESGFLCENRKLLTFQTRDEAEFRIKDIRNLCLNHSPAADYECVEYPNPLASDRRMHLEMLRALDTVPAFTSDNFEIENRTYDNTGGGCMVATLEVYLPDLDKRVWVNCNDELVDICSADYVWNEDGSDSYERWEDVRLFIADFRQDRPDSTGPWFPIIQKALEYTIEQETARFGESCTFSLPILWLPASLREHAEPDYLNWLREQDKEISIAKDGRIVIDEAYLADSHAQAGAGSLEMR